jgi:hypothetical protein
MRRRPTDREKEARKCHCGPHKAIPSIPRLVVDHLNRSRSDVAAWLPLGVFHRATPVPRFCREVNLTPAFFQHSFFICLHRNCKTAASLGRRLCLLRILRQVHNRQHPLEEDAA